MLIRGFVVFSTYLNSSSCSALLCSISQSFLQGALALSQSQKDDILMLRRLFFSELGRLSQERQDLYDSMARHSNRLSRVKAYAEQLQQNVTAQHQTYLQMLQALYLGVSCLELQHMLANSDTE